jgi:hypothetical protein
MFVNNLQLPITNIVSSNAQNIYSVVHVHAKFSENSKFSFKIYDRLNTNACLILQNNKRRRVTNLTSIMTSEVVCWLTQISSYKTSNDPATCIFTSTLFPG